MKTTCPTCKAVVEGTLDVLTKHVRRCGKVPKKPGLAHAVTTRARLVKVALPHEMYFSCVIPSQNRSHGDHWTEYNALRSEWRGAVQYFMSELHGADFQWSRWSFLRLIPKGGKRYDFANLVGGAKPVVDALTHFGIIHDDADQYFKADYDQMPIAEWTGKSSLNVHSVITLLEAR